MSKPSLPPLETVLIEDQAQLERLCVAIRAEGSFGFDTEFVMEDRYQSELCLLQLSSTTTVALVDPKRGLDLQPVWALLCDRNVQTIVHAGQEDLALFVQQTNLPPANVFDLQIAAGLVGLDYPLSLQKLVESTLGVRLHKSRTLTDWRRRPLSDEQIRYAAEDVAYLLPVQQKLHRLLTRHKRLSWAREEFDHLEAAVQQQHTQEAPVKRPKGLGALAPRQMAVAEHILAWRDIVARERNRPARTVLKDHLLLEVARHGLQTPEEIGSLRGVNLSRRDIRSLCETVQQAVQLPSDQWPTRGPRQPDVPHESTFINFATAVVRAYCQTNKLAYALCATKQSITELVRYRLRGSPPSAGTPGLLRGWRAQTVGVLLDDVLAGRTAVIVTLAKGHASLGFIPSPSNSGNNHTP